jgi:hypothetical protein
MSLVATDKVEEMVAVSTGGGGETVIFNLDLVRGDLVTTMSNEVLLF